MNFSKSPGTADGDTKGSGLLLLLVLVLVVAVAAATPAAESAGAAGAASSVASLFGADVSSEIATIMLNDPPTGTSLQPIVVLGRNACIKLPVVFLATAAASQQTKIHVFYVVQAHAITLHMMMTPALLLLFSIRWAFLSGLRASRAPRQNPGITGSRGIKK